MALRWGRWEKKVELKIVVLYLIAGAALILTMIPYVRHSAMEINTPAIPLAESVDDSNKGSIVSVEPEKLLHPKTGINWVVPLNFQHEIEMIWIKPGTFTMGSPEDELGRESDETQHEVTLTLGYWLGKYEVTQAQYEAVMGTNPSEFKGADLPVECVSWNDAKEFCNKLTAIEEAAGRLPEGYEYTLPTEAQWEYACCAGTTTALNSGKNLSSTSKCPEMDEVGWYYYNNDLESHPVGQKKPNAWGLYDMHGNVWEWSLDWYGDYLTSEVTVLKGYSTGERCVFRGGSWSSNARNCRSANRYFSPPATHYNHVGFRICLSSGSGSQ